MICPSCNGEKESFGIGCGSNGCKPMSMKCYRCQGVGTVPDAMKEWIENGNILREKRLKNNVGLREFAKSINMLPSEYSAIEMGRVDNSGFLI